MASERRQSMAERRPSILSPSGTMGQTSSLIVPHLAGIEDPLPTTTPSTVDVVIAGTGLVESILAAALAWQGSNILHIDSNNYYGDTGATLTVDQVKNWVDLVNKGTYSKCYNEAKCYVSRNFSQNQYISRDFGIDLAPKILFAKSDLLSILVKSRVYQYLEFQSLSNFHTFENDCFEKLKNSKQEIFVNQMLPLMTKRSLMRFIKFVLDWENQLDIWKPYQDKSIISFLAEKFKLEQPQIFELVFSIGLCYNINIKTSEALPRIRRYLMSFDVYGPFPVLHSKYGGPGELSQGFCRSAAVAGATYKLNHSIVSYDPESKIVQFNDGSKVTVTEKLVVSPTQCPANTPNLPEQKYEVQRLTCIVEKDCSQWFHESENAAIVVFPPDSLKTGNKQAVQTLILGPGSGVCPKGTCLWYLHTTESGVRGELSLDAALEALEVSILRESSDDLVYDENIIHITPSGLPIVNSVKLGRSFKEFVPRERLHLLMKLYYKQYTSTPPFHVVNSQFFQFKDTTPDSSVLFTSMPSAEMSYDEAITAAKVIYEKIVGSDDDFFNIDFEDEDESKTVQDYDVSILNEEHVDDDVSMLGSESVVFPGEMEL